MNVKNITFESSQASINISNNANGSNSQEVKVYQKYISDEDFVFIIISLLTVTNGVISIFGIVTNILNIFVFIKQGVFSDSSTVSLFGLAFADLLSVATALWVGIMFSVALVEPRGLNWKPSDIMLMTGAFPHLIFGLITRMINALIAFERCFCVVFPFKVRSVFTPRSSSIMVFVTFAYYILTYIPVYLYHTFHFIKDSETNTTRLVLVQHPEWRPISVVLTYGNLMSLNFISVIVVLICTTITISRVKLSSMWRENLAISGNRNEKQENSLKVGSEMKFEKDSEQFEKLDKTAKRSGAESKLSSSRMQRDKKLIRMITLISVLFLASYMPNISLPIVFSYNREIRTGGLYKNLAWTLFTLCWIFETLNSSINIFIYYRMSSKFRVAFNDLFGVIES